MPTTAQDPISEASNLSYPLEFCSNINFPTIPGISTMHSQNSPIKANHLSQLLHLLYLLSPSHIQPWYKNQIMNHHSPPNMPNITLPDLQGPKSYKHTPQNIFSVEVKKPIKNVEQDEIDRKIKSLEKNMRNIQVLGGHKSVSFNDL